MEPCDGSEDANRIENFKHLGGHIQTRTWTDIQGQKVMQRCDWKGAARSLNVASFDVQPVKRKSQAARCRHRPTVSLLNACSGLNPMAKIELLVDQLGQTLAFFSCEPANRLSPSLACYR